jgi:hypothetical protein
LKRYIVTGFDGNNDVEEILTEDEILDYYWNYWSSAQWSAGVDPIDITPEDCILDFVLVHWAQEIEEDTHDQH